MHVLCFRGRPIAVADRWERLASQLSLYTEAQQAEMEIIHVPVLE